MVELENQGLKCEKNKRLIVSYKGIEIGDFTSDVEVGLLLNIYIEGQHKRMVYTNDMRKGNFIGK